MNPNMSSSLHRVFVYGTLKQGQRNFHFLQDAEFVGQFSTEPIYSMFIFEDYPAVCVDGQHTIHGEIYRVNEAQFGLLDELEWYPDFYQRIEIPTHHGDTWMYIVEAELCEGKQQLHGMWP
jgi:gamma-glutamylcyclotransferase (GGCT)/AIG2-like uncharacterized protein YtfP